MDGEIQVGPAGRDSSGKGVRAGEKAVGFVPGTWRDWSRGLARRWFSGVFGECWGTDFWL